MTNPEIDHAVGKVKEILTEEIRVLSLGQKARLGEVSQWDNEGLIVMDQSFAFWCADAMIRLIGVEESPETNWLEVYQEALDRAAGLTLDILADGFLKLRDAKSFIGLITLHLDRGATLREFNKRIIACKFGRAMMTFLADRNETSVDGLFNEIRSGAKGLAKQKILPKEYISDLREQLKVPFRISFDHQEKDTHKDTHQDALLTIMERYGEIGKKIKTKDWSQGLYSLFSEFRKMEGSAWERIAPGMLAEMTRKSLELFLPILEGKLENMPYEVCKNHINSIRQDLSWKVNQSWKNLSEGQEEESNRRSLKFWGEKQVAPLDWNIKDDKTPEGEILQREEGEFFGLLKIKQTLEELISKAEKPEQLREAFHLMEEGKTQKEAAEITGLSDRTLRHYQSKLLNLYARR